MSLHADNLLDRMRLKGDISRWRAMTIVLLAVLLVILFGKSVDEVGGPLSVDFIARIEVKDLIVEDRERDKIIEDIKNNNSIKAVIVHVNSPGGTIVGGETLYSSLRELADVKPLVATMGSLATSGGYMASIAADRIYARQGTVTGSIGVMLQTAEISELGDKMGINFFTFRSAPLKGTPSPFEKISPEAVAAVQNSIDDGYKMFIDMVVDRRGLKRGVVEKLADGRIYSGTRAVEHKLIDSIGGEKEALEWLVTEKSIQENLPIKEISLKKDKKKLKGFYNLFFDGFDKISFGAFTEKGMLSLWQPSLL